MRNKEENIKLVESILFLKGEDGITLRELSKTIGLKPTEAKEIVNHVETKLIYERGTVYTVENIDELYKLTLKKENFKIVRDALAETNEEKLSKSVIEALTVIAYNQPVVKSDIENIKGSSADYAVSILKNLELIVSTGKDKTRKGHPSIYVTTSRFLELFGLETLGDLPSKEEADLDEKTREIKNLFELEMTKEFESFDLD